MTSTAAALADLLRAFSILQPGDDAARMAVARMLGLQPVESITVHEPAAPSRHVRVEDRAEARDEVERRKEPPREQRPPVSTHQRTSEPTELNAVLKPDFTAARRLPGWLERVTPLPEVGGETSPAVPVPDPLFDPRWTRALLSGSLATFSETGPLDTDRLVRGVARGVPWRIVPRRPWPTLARGVQVLVDRGDAMLPFAADQDELLKKLRLVVGRNLLDELRFDGCPTRGAGAGSRRTWKPYFERHRPHPGMAVLALTDLGIGDSGLRSTSGPPGGVAGLRGRAAPGRLSAAGLRPLRV